MEDKTKKKILITLIIIIFLLLGGLTYYKFVVYKGNNSNIVENNKEVIDNNEEEKETEITKDLELANSLMINFDKLYINYQNLYSTGMYDISSITPYEIMDTVLENISIKNDGIELSDTNLPSKIADIDTINTAISKLIYGKTITLNYIRNNLEKDKRSSDKEFYSLTNGSIYIDSSDNIYFIDSSIGKSSDQILYPIRKVVDYKEKGDYLYVSAKVGFAYDTQGQSLKSEYLIYKDYNKTELVERHDRNSNELKYYDEDLGIHTINYDLYDFDWDSYDTYTYTFKKINGNYYFQKLGKAELN